MYCRDFYLVSKISISLFLKFKIYHLKTRVPKTALNFGHYFLSDMHTIEINKYKMNKALKYNSWFKNTATPLWLSVSHLCWCHHRHSQECAVLPNRSVVAHYRHTERIFVWYRSVFEWTPSAGTPETNACKAPTKFTRLLTTNPTIVCFFTPTKAVDS